MSKDTFNLTVYALLSEYVFQGCRWLSDRVLKVQNVVRLRTLLDALNSCGLRLVRMLDEYVNFRRFEGCRRHASFKLADDFRTVARDGIRINFDLFGIQCIVYFEISPALHRDNIIATYLFRSLHYFPNN